MFRKPKKYYFNTRGQEPDMVCTELCPVLNNGTYIGSVKCQKCENCISSDSDDYGCSWIDCEKLDALIKVGGICIDCGFDDIIKTFDMESEYDEFHGRDCKYPVCPKCGGGVETYTYRET